MKNTIFAGLALMFALNTSSCKKETVEGPQGPAGATGQTGANGVNGTNGNANIQSYSYVAYGSDWDSIGVLNQYGCGKIYTMNVPAITQSVYDSGFVFIYMESDSTVAQLPWTVFYPGYQKTFEAVHKPGMAQIRCYTSTLTYPALGLYTYIRVVVGTGQPKIMAPQLNWNNYAEVSKFFNLR